MSDVFAEYGLFLAKVITFLVAALVVLSAVAGAAMRQQRGQRGHLEVRSLNDHYDRLRDEVRSAVLDDKTFKKQAKAEAKARKKQRGQTRERLFVLRFDGDLQASEADDLRELVSAVLSQAEAGDEVLACIESPGGMVHGYGLAASQLHRLRAREGLSLTVAIDKVAASGGYLMACIGDRILAAPFAIVGSIGVVAQIPNVHRLLKKHDVDVEVLTAGEYKRTLTVLGENTDKGREKFLEELEDVHALFKEFVVEQRASLDIERVATGEAWYGRRALDVGLVDELLTSDEYIQRACEDRDVYELEWVLPRSPVDRIMHQLTAGASRAAERVLLRWRDRRTWTG